MGFSTVTAITLTAANTAYPVFNGHRLAKSVFIQPKFSNSGVLLIGDSTLAVATDTGIIKQLEAPTADHIPSFDYTEVDVPNGIDLGELFLSSSQSGDVVYVSYNVQ